MRSLGIMLIILVFLLIAASLRAAVVIQIPPEIKVNTEVVCLKDIVLNKQDLPAAWQNIVLGNIVIPGGSLEISKQYLKARLLQRGIALKDFILKAPAKIRIIRDYIKIPAKEIEEMAKACILKHNPKGKIETIQLKAPSDLILPVGKITYRCLEPAQGTYIGSFSLPLVFSVNGKDEAKTWVIAKVKTKISVVVTTRSLRRNEVITAQDVRIEKRTLDRIPVDLISDPKEVIGKETKYFLKMGEVLTKNKIKRVPIVKRGSKVTIVAESPVLRITAPGMAKEDGCKGDMIKVLNLTSKKTIYAKVIDAHTVKVEF